ncbi:hypothetical protein HDU97_002123 [Phlyctochytrium planicorne]|nr:hypothetical protein HDU97_002123 [Phlyctochytrium planicorne]
MHLILIVAAVASAAVASSAAPLEKRDINSINWGPCTRFPEPLQCATLNVPLNYLDPNDNRTIPLAVSRWPATKPSRGAILVNRGGPGGSGVSFARSVATRLATALDGSYDVIGFDPRGIATSLPVICAPNPAVQNAMDGQEFIGVPGTKEGVNVEVMDALGQLRAKGCQTFSAFNGEWVKYISTAFVARDMDFIRKTIGQDLLNYIGYSYGTYIGMTYVNLFPNNVGRIIIDGVVDPTFYSTDIYSDGKGALADSDDVLLGFAKECEQAGTTRCALADLASKVTISPELIPRKDGPGRMLYAAIRQSIKNLAAEPLVSINSSFPGIVKSSDVIGYIFSLLYGPSGWQASADTLAALFIQKDPNPFREENNGITGPEDFCPTLQRSGSNGYHAVRCSDAEDLTTTSREDVVIKASKPDRATFMAQKGTTVDGLTCRHWTRPVERYQGPWNSKLNSKILIISSLLDPVTPLASAKKVHSLLSPSNSSYFLLHKGYGHTSNGQPGACTLRTIGNYFFNGTLLNEGKGATAECSPDFEIFPDRAAGFAAKSAAQSALNDAAALGKEIAEVNFRW